MSMSEEFAVVVPWIDEEQIASWLRAWEVSDPPDWLMLTQDKEREGCATTKNRGISRAVDQGADVVVVVDDDCYPAYTNMSLEGFAQAHVRALEPQPVTMFQTVTDPPSRGTPFEEHQMVMPVAASMGFWHKIGDYDAPRQLAYRGQRMDFFSQTIHGRYFPLSGMNLAFRPAEWIPWCLFIDVPRFDDIWMGWLWQKAAYRRGACFNLNGPPVVHARQSNVWRNLAVESRHLEANETLWREIAEHPGGSYDELLELLPADPGGSDR